jgi:hypothetical protein
MGEKGIPLRNIKSNIIRSTTNIRTITIASTPIADFGGGLNNYLPNKLLDGYGSRIITTTTSQGGEWVR